MLKHVGEVERMAEVVQVADMKSSSRQNKLSICLPAKLNTVSGEDQPLCLMDGQKIERRYVRCQQ